MIFLCVLPYVFSMIMFSSSIICATWCILCMFLGLSSESPRTHLSPCILFCYNTMLNKVHRDSEPIPWFVQYLNVIGEVLWSNGRTLDFGARGPAIKIWPWHMTEKLSVNPSVSGYWIWKNWWRLGGERRGDRHHHYIQSYAETYKQ